MKMLICGTAPALMVINHGQLNKSRILDNKLHGQL